MDAVPCLHLGEMLPAPGFRSDWRGIVNMPMGQVADAIMTETDQTYGLDPKIIEIEIVGA